MGILFFANLTFSIMMYKALAIVMLPFCQLHCKKEVEKEVEGEGNKYCTARGATKHKVLIIEDNQPVNKDFCDNFAPTLTGGKTYKGTGKMFKCGDTSFNLTKECTSE